MGQQECLDWLKKEYKKDPNKWFKVKEVQAGLMRDFKLSQSAVKRAGPQLLTLTLLKDVRMKGHGIWKHYKLFKYRNGRKKTGKA